MLLSTLIVTCPPPSPLVHNKDCVFFYAPIGVILSIIAILKAVSVLSLDLQFAFFIIRNQNSINPSIDIIDFSHYSIFLVGVKRIALNAHTLCALTV